MSGEHHFQEEKGIHIPHSSKKEIWTSFWILLGLTVLEFAVAFTPDVYKEAVGGRTTVVIIFILLTILKAFYIVAYFMHMKHEKLNLAYTILVPMVFVIFLAALLIYESMF
jgi:cytochrome c oxidase subunit IV